MLLLTNRNVSKGWNFYVFIKMFSLNILTVCQMGFNKKVLLRERKRHIARRVASAQGGGYLPWMGGGVPTLGYLIPPS